MALGASAGVLFIFFSLKGREPGDALSVTTIGLSIMALGLGVGGALAGVGSGALRGRLSRPFRPGMKWFWVCLVGLALALLVGQMIVSLDLLAPVTFPPFHVLATALPALSMLILVGQGVKHNAPAATQRQVIGQVALGAFGTTAMAFTFEAIVAVLGLLITGVVVALIPGGLLKLAELQAMLTDPAWLQDPQLLARWLLNPGVLFLVTLMLVIIVPLIEEAAKSIGVPLLALGTGRRPSAAQGWLWGIAVGTGFAITEGLFNGAASLPFWAGIALLRIGATAMQVVTAGITGLGWRRALASRGFLFLLGSYLTSVTLHGLWNGLTVMIVVSSLWIMAQPEDPIRIAGGGLGIVAGVTGLVLIVATLVGVAICVTLRVRERQSVTV